MPGFLTSKSKMPGLPATAGMGDTRVHGDHTNAEAFDNHNPVNSGYDRQHGPRLEAGAHVMDVQANAGAMHGYEPKVGKFNMAYDTRHPITGQWAKSARSTADTQNTSEGF